MQLPGINTEKLIECLQEANNAIARMVKRIYPAIANIKVPRMLLDISEIFSENDRPSCPHSKMGERTHP